MSDVKDVEQAPSSEHVDRVDIEKYETEITVPKETQLSICRKVRSYHGCVPTIDMPKSLSTV